MNEDYSNYPFVDKEEETKANERFNEFSFRDPLPEIQPALLNSGDIYDYARITSMVFPFDENKLKSASYEIDFLGDVYQVNEKTGEVEKETLEQDKPFTLKKNSIVFLFIKTKFFLPDYIAIRFNLRITHVHRGLLLGTGPLVDPGFVGRLLIPLHNLTSEDHVIYGGEGLIWVEFTKLSPHRRWKPTARSGAEYHPFPPSKRDLSAQQYFNKASKGKPALSSIPGEVATFKRIAEKAGSHVKYLSGIGLVGILGLVYLTWDITSNANQNIVTARDQMKDFIEKLNNSDKKIESLEAQIKSLTESLEKVKKDRLENVRKSSSRK